MQRSVQLKVEFDIDSADVKSVVATAALPQWHPQPQSPDIPLLPVFCRSANNCAGAISRMEACNDRYFLVQRLFGIGFRSSLPSIQSETFQASPSEDGTRFACGAWARQRPRAMALRSSGLREGRFRFLTAIDHEQSARRREPGDIHERALLAI